MLETGARVPRITMLDDSGKTVNIGDLYNKTLVLWFYPKDDTPG
jgi:peroxiredoxin